MAPRRIYTIGHSTHSLDELVALLRGHGVDQLADVRAYPSSRRMPRLNRERLSRDLPAYGIAYVHLPRLGGRRAPSSSRANAGWRVAGFRGYADYMASRDFEAGLEELAALASRRTTAMMCAEALWWRCHRRLVSDALTVRGWEVVHVAPTGRATTHELTPFRRGRCGGHAHLSAKTSRGRVRTKARRTPTDSGNEPAAVCGSMRQENVVELVLHTRATAGRRRTLAASVAFAVLALVLLFPARGSAQEADPAGDLPLAFAPDAGQTDDSVRYVARGAGYSFFFTDEQAVLSLVKADGQDVTGLALELGFVGASPDARLDARDPAAGTVSQLTGSGG